MGVTDVYAGATNASGSGLASTQGFRWLITYAGLTDADVSGINFQRAIQASTREWAGADDLAGVADTWVGVAVRSPGAPFAPSVYTFDVVNKTIISSGHVAGTPGAVGSPYFSIGAFPWTSGWGTGPQDVRIAKISLFNRMVTDVEIAELNDAMMFGPPSP